VKSENTLENDNMRRVNSCLLFETSMLLERVDGDVYLLSVVTLAWVLYKETVHIYPSLMFLNRSTRKSKSIASGESKSYSFEKAFADCSALRGL